MMQPSLLQRVMRRLDKTLASAFFIDQWVILTRAPGRLPQSALGGLHSADAREGSLLGGSICAAEERAAFCVR